MNQQVIITNKTAPTGIKFMGFSTQDPSANKKYTLYDMDLAKQDLLNQFYTRKGERVMLPNFGCIIWDLLFETLDDANKQAIVDDATRIVNSDPRITLRDINIVEVEYGIMVSMDLWYAPQNMNTTLSINFDTLSQDRNTTGV